MSHTTPPFFSFYPPFLRSCIFSPYLFFPFPPHLFSLILSFCLSLYLSVCFWCRFDSLSVSVCVTRVPNRAHHPFRLAGAPLSATMEGPRIALHTLRGAAGASKQAIRVGRGRSSRRGKTAGRGHKGQGQHAANRVRLGFEGGQTPLYRRQPKRGFTNP